MGLSQVPEFCSAPLSYRADPSELQRFRQQCTIQKLIAERADEANKATATEVEEAVTAARLKALEESKRLTDEYWKQYVEGVQTLSEWWKDYGQLADATCSWKGVFNVPTAKMCKAWQGR